MSQPEHPDPFDFDRWAELAASDAGAFERARAAAIEGIIDSSPPAMRARLHGLQWRIDQVRRQSGSPVGACVKLSQMMWETILGPQGLVENIERLAEPSAVTTTRPRAEVLPFRGIPPRAQNTDLPDAHPVDGGHRPGNDD